MSDNQKVGQGALFKNDKQGVDKRPDYTGQATILNKKFYVSAWLATSQGGMRYMSLAFTESQAANNAGTQNNKSASQQSNNKPAQNVADDDEIPF